MSEIKRCEHGRVVDDRCHECEIVALTDANCELSARAVELRDKLAERDAELVRLREDLAVEKATSRKLAASISHVTEYVSFDDRALAKAVGGHIGDDVGPIAVRMMRQLQQDVDSLGRDVVWQNPDTGEATTAKGWGCLALEARAENERLRARVTELDARDDAMRDEVAQVALMAADADAISRAKLIELLELSGWSEDRIYALPQAQRSSEWLSAAERCEQLHAEVERLRKNEASRLEQLEEIGWPCWLDEIIPKYAGISAENGRLRDRCERLKAAIRVQYRRAYESRWHRRYQSLHSENERLRKVVCGIATHRRDCHAYDEDMGREPRTFLDEEEWDRVEAAASAALRDPDEDGDFVAMHPLEADHE